MFFTKEIDYDNSGMSLTGFTTFEEVKVVAEVTSQRGLRAAYDPDAQPEPVASAPVQQQQVATPSNKNVTIKTVINAHQKNSPAAKQQAAVVSQPEPVDDGKGSEVLDTMKQLEMLADLRVKGILTKEEFEAKKKQILGI